MKHSVSEVAELLEVDRRTLQRWVNRKQIPAPVAGIIMGKLVKFWTDEEVRLIQEHKTATYGGKGLNRKTGRKAKQQDK